MFDNPIDQNTPSIPERFGVCVHGLIHFVTTREPVIGVISADKKDVKIVTNGGKIFYPFVGSTDKYNIYVEQTENTKCFLFQHPSAQMFAEDENGRDWSGYAVLHEGGIALSIDGVKLINLDRFPLVPDSSGEDDPRLAVFAGSRSCYRYVLEWPEGDYEEEGVVTNTGLYPIKMTVFSSDGRYRARPITRPWHQSIIDNNHIRMAKISGIWPDIEVNTYDADGVDYYKIERISDSQRKVIKIDSRAPLAGVCIHPVPDLSFRYTETLADDQYTPDHYTQEEINTTLLTCDVLNDGSLNHLTLTVRQYSDFDRAVSVSGSISTAAGDASGCATQETPDGWVLYDGAKQSYAVTEKRTGSDSFEVTVSGFGGESKYVRSAATTYNSSNYVSVGSGTMSENIDEFEQSSSETLDITLDGMVIDHGISNPQISGAYNHSFKTGLPFGTFGINSSYEWLFITETGSGVYDGGVIALLRVFMYRYNGDMYALACGIARGYAVEITDREYHFELISQELKIGSVFSHGRHHEGSYTGDDVGALLFGASNPKTGEIVRDMPYPAIYI